MPLFRFTAEQVEVFDVTRWMSPKPTNRRVQCASKTFGTCSDHSSFHDILDGPAGIHSYFESNRKISVRPNHTAVRSPLEDAKLQLLPLSCITKKGEIEVCVVG